jgi:hypothetical protein
VTALVLSRPSISAPVLEGFMPPATDAVVAAGKRGQQESGAAVRLTRSR